MFNFVLFFLVKKLCSRIRALICNTRVRSFCRLIYVNIVDNLTCFIFLKLLNYSAADLRPLFL